MKKRDSQEIIINVQNNAKKINQNQLVQLSYLLMSAIFVFEIFAFAYSVPANVPYTYGFSGGLMSSIFCLGYMIAALFSIRRNEENTYISLLYFVVIYSIPCAWMGLWYFITQTTQIYDLLEFFVCIFAMVIAVLAIIFYYRNNLKSSSIFALISMILSIVAIIFTGTTEIIKAIQDWYKPLIAIALLLEAVGGSLPLYYLFKTL